MKELKEKLNEKYFGSFPRDSLKILKFMAEKYPKKLIFTSEELSKIIGLKDRALGGVLGAFSKRKKNIPIVYKVGTVSTGWGGQKFSRPKQVWAINPKLKKVEVFQIRETLKYFLLD